jgi:hypothetical protein
VSSADSNGSYVSRAELAAHIKGIDEHFDTVEGALLEIKDLLGDRKVLFRAWMPPIIAAMIAGAVSLGVAFLFYP